MQNSDYTQLFKQLPQIVWETSTWIYGLSVTGFFIGFILIQLTLIRSKSTELSPVLKNIRIVLIYYIPASFTICGFLTGMTVGMHVYTITKVEKSASILIGLPKAYLPVMTQHLYQNWHDIIDNQVSKEDVIDDFIKQYEYVPERNGTIESYKAYLVNNFAHSVGGWLFSSVTKVAMEKYGSSHILKPTDELLLTAIKNLDVNELDRNDYDLILSELQYEISDFFKTIYIQLSLILALFIVFPTFELFVIYKRSSNSQP